MILPFRSRKAYLSGWSRVQAFYGTAEAVPFVCQSPPQALMVSESFTCCPSWPGEESNLDRSEIVEKAQGLKPRSLLTLYGPKEVGS
jgi:hypothetical protein